MTGTHYTRIHFTAGKKDQGVIFLIFVPNQINAAEMINMLNPKNKLNPIIEKTSASAAPMTHIQKPHLGKAFAR